MKNIKYMVLSLLVAGGLFTACTCDDLTEKDPYADNYNVYFPEQKYPYQGAITLHPTDDPTEITYTVKRKKTDEAIEIPYTLSGDTDIFVVTPEVIRFEKGKDTTTFTVSFDDSEIGVDYSLLLEFDDPKYEYIRPYTAASFLNITLSRGNWIQLNADSKLEFYGEIYEGYSWYTDDLFIPWYAGYDPLTYPVIAEVREDTIDEDYPNGPNGYAGMYRIIYPYGPEYPYNDDGDYDTSKDHHITLEVIDEKHVFFGYQSLGIDWGDGITEAFDLGTYAYLTGQSSTLNPVFGTVEDGAIVFKTPNGFVVWDDEYADYSNPNGAFCLIIDQKAYDAAHPDGE